MLDVGFSEILLTSAIALIVLGPERLPKVARQVGSWMGRARAMARQLSEQLEREVNAEELLKIQSKPISGTSLPGSNEGMAQGGTNVNAAPTSVAPTPATIAAPVTASDATPVTEAISAVPRPPDPVFGGLPPSATTAAAMHASDPPAAGSQSPHE
jgi:sec-independent protein translocase protein TatB